MIRKLIGWLTSKLPPPRVIFDRDGKEPYLSRYYILGAPVAPDGAPFDASGNPKVGIKWSDGLGIFLHRFHRGDDGDELHNHPWGWSVSIILAGGYFEERRHGLDVHSHEYRPGSINVLRADTFHRVDLRESDCWSLFVAGPKVQGWGFWDRTNGMFTPWRRYIVERRARLHFEQAMAEAERRITDVRTRERAS